MADLRFPALTYPAVASTIALSLLPSHLEESYEKHTLNVESVFKI